jgi:hypothetical protein
VSPGVVTSRESWPGNLADMIHGGGDGSIAAGGGNLYFDADGAAAQILFAHLRPGLSLTSRDFSVV